MELLENSKLYMYIHTRAKNNLRFLSREYYLQNTQNVIVYDKKNQHMYSIQAAAAGRTKCALLVQPASLPACLVAWHNICVCFLRYAPITIQFTINLRQLLKQLLLTNPQKKGLPNISTPNIDTIAIHAHKPKISR